MKKFTMFFMAIFAALSLQAAELNIYACGLNATVSDNVATVEYVLNAPATGLELQLYAAGADPILVPITAAEALTKGAHSVEVDLSGVKAGTYTWGLKASAAATAAYAEVTNDSTDAWKFYSPQGIAVNQNPESPFFGNVYVTMPSPGASDGECARTKTQKAGLYMFNSRLEALNDSAYQFGLTFEVGKREQFKRISVGFGDDKLYVNDITHKKVYIIDPNDMTKVDSTIEAAGHFTYPASLVVGTKKWVLLDYPNTTTGGALVRFDKATGAMDTLLQSTKWVNGESSIARDGHNGWWVCQYRGQLDVYPCISHLGTADTIDYLINKNSPEDLQNLIDRSTGSTYSTRGAMAVSRSGHLLAMAMNRCVRVYAVTYDEATGVPSMSIAYTTPPVGKNIDGMAFDAADNLYISSASTERLFVYATTKADNSFVTPAAAAKTIVVEGPKTLASVLADKTIRRALNDQEHVYVLAIDADKNPTLVKADLEGNVVTEYATDFCSVTADGVMKLSDIAMTEDGVLIGCNQEKCVFAYSGNTNPFQVYKWAADGTGEVALTYSYAYLVSMTWSNGYTGVTMAFKGTLADGQMLVAGKSASGGAKDKMKQLLLEIKADTIYSASVNTNEKKIIAGLQNINYPADLQFITLGSEKVPQLFTYVNTGGIDKYETIHSSLANVYSGTQGASVAKKGDAVWMMVPSIDGVEILDITAGLASAAQVHELAAASSLEADFLYAGLVEDGKKVVLMRGANLEVISLPKYLNDVLADKTIRRVVNDQEHVYVLAVDADKNPTLVKADLDGKIVREYATDSCSVTTDGVMKLSDIALTEDGVLVGCNQEKCMFGDGSGNTNPILFYKWTDEGAISIAFRYSDAFRASVCWVNGYTGGTMAFKGTLADGQILISGQSASGGAAGKYKQLMLQITDNAVAKGTVNEGQKLLIPGLQNINYPESAQFITLGSEKVPQLFEYDNSGAGATKTETLKGALAATYSGKQGASVAKKDAATWMMIPSTSGVEILNITAGLASAPQVHNLTAASTVEASFMYAGLVEDGEKVVLMRGTSLELIDVPGTGTEIEEVEAASAEVKKVIVNGHIFIIREGHMYDMNGMQVK